jgi:uncharacterized protein (UPF0371 family)
VLPGFEPDTKVRMLKSMVEEVEIILVINAADIEKGKIRHDLGITYDEDLLRLMDNFLAMGFYVGGVVITRFTGQPDAVAFRDRLKNLGIKSYLHYPIANYPNDIEHIVSDEGYGRNDYIETSRPLVVITAPGPGSGKMATCLSQLYLDNKRGIRSGYAKFETFPIWNLPLSHPVNLAYEAATADLNDVNMVDPFHLAAYGETAVNYNRDVEIFPVVKAMFEHIYGECPYQSPTDMGVNMAGCCIFDDEAVREGARDEILRRYYAALCRQRKGEGNDNEVAKIKILMAKDGLEITHRPVIDVALQYAEETGGPAVSLQLQDGRIVKGKTSQLLGACSAMLLNALKALANIPQETKLISPAILEPVSALKIERLGNQNPRLHPDEVLIALSICAVTDETARRALECLSELRNCEAHASVILAQNDINTLKKLGIQITCEPRYQTKKLYHG